MKAPITPLLCLALCGVAEAETFQIDFGPVNQTLYTGEAFGKATNVRPSNPGDPGDEFSLRNLEYRLGDATLSAPLVGAYNLEGDAAAGSVKALTGSFIFANPNNSTVGKSVELKLTGVRKGAKVTIEVIRAEQYNPARVTVYAGEAKQAKDVMTDQQFTAFDAVTGQDTYTIKITHVGDEPAEADIAGMRVTIDELP